MRSLARAAFLAVAFALVGCDSCRTVSCVTVTVRNRGKTPIKARCHVGGRERTITVMPGQEWREKVDRTVDGEAWVVFED